MMILNAIYLLSGRINKEFSFRHDWNSLISDDETLQMKHYTKAYFPHADDYVSWPSIHAHSMYTHHIL